MSDKMSPKVVKLVAITKMFKELVDSLNPEEKAELDEILRVEAEKKYKKAVEKKEKENDGKS